MSFQIWLAFAIASAILLVIPGPTVMLVVSYALGRGRMSAWATIPGVALGDFTAMTISLLGAGAILAASAFLFTVMKLIGAAYLVWLGLKLWGAKPDIADNQGDDNKNRVTGRDRQSQFAMFWHAFIVTALNPKGIVFFVAFVPQFINPSQPPFAQFALMEATFIILATINIIIWALLASKLRERFLRPNTFGLINKIGGTFLITAGLLTATLRNSQ